MRKNEANFKSTTLECPEPAQVVNESLLLNRLPPIQAYLKEVE